MNASVRRRPTRAYVVGVIAATLVVASTLVVVSWGLLGLTLGREPVETNGVPLWFGILAVGAGLVLLGMLLWQQALSILRGSSAPLWGLVLGGGAGSYLIWCLLGLAFGLTLEETWMSPFAIALAFAWAISALLFWGVLVRHIYTDRPTPQWPWEKREAAERAAEDREAERRQAERDARDDEDFGGSDGDTGDERDDRDDQGWN